MSLVSRYHLNARKCCLIRIFVNKSRLFELQWVLSEQCSWTTYKYHRKHPFFFFLTWKHSVLSLSADTNTWYLGQGFVLSCAHATPDRHSQDHTHSSNFSVILYFFACHSSFLGRGGLVLCLESYREFSNTYFSDWVCVLNVTTWFLEAVRFYCFQNSSFLNNVLPISKPNFWWLFKRCPKEWDKRWLTWRMD